MSGPPPAPPNLSWGRYRSRNSAYPEIRLRCMLLDAITSPILLEHPHKEGPYFGTKKCIWQTWISNADNLQPILAGYGLDGNLGIAEICIEISAETGRSGNIFGEGLFHAIDAEIFAWDVNVEPVRFMTESGSMDLLGRQMSFYYANR